MNLMDMLSGDAPDAMFQSNAPDDMQFILDNAAPPSSIMNLTNDDSISNNNNKNDFQGEADAGPIQTNNGVYHLPTVLTNVQRELTETVLQVLSPILLSEAHTKRQRASINSLLDNSSDDNPSFLGNPRDKDDDSQVLAFYDKVNLLYDQLRIIKKHPSLLVEHFIPKKLLLSEINERLINLSGKLQLFNRIINSFIDRFPRDLESNFSHSKLSKTGYHILVVADGIKELELIEGVIIGKKLHYKNLSGSKLYNDKKPMPNFNHEDDMNGNITQVNGASHINGTSGSPHNGDSSKTKKRWGSRSNASSEAKRKKQMQRSSGTNESFLCLYLVTSSQLYNNYTPASNSENSEFNLIISFDSNLDTKNPSIELIRNNKSASSSSLQQQELKTPILIPLPLFTLDHIALEYPAPSNYGRSNFRFDERDPSSQLFQWKFQCLNVFAVNRFNNFDPLIFQDFYHRNYGSNMEKLYTWFHKWDTIKFPLHHVMDHYNDKLILHFSEDKLIKKLEHNYLFDTELLPYRQVKEDQFQKKNRLSMARLERFGCADYKKKVAELLNERVAQTDDTVVEKFQRDLPDFRIKETLRQINLDTQEEAIAERYRKLRKLNDDAIVSERKLSRADADYSKLEVIHTDLNEKLHYLTTIKDDSDESKLTDIIESQAQQLKELKEELNSLEAEYTKLNDENEHIRSKYQNSSSEAVQLSTRLASLKDENSRLSTKLNGPGIRIIPSLIKKDDLINYEVELNKITKENEFINHYFGAKLDKLIKERNTVLDNTTSGSSSRPGNRVSRGSTPF